MSKLIQTLLLGIVGVAILGTAGPTISRLISAIVPLVLVLVLVVGAVVAVLQLVHYFTRS
jgi:hypothetical protein